MKDLDISELRALVRSVLEEDMGGMKPTMTPSAHAMLNTGSKGGPPPLPGKKPASAALPAKGALNKFKADVSMMADAAARVKAAVDAADTKEALRWLEKVAAFAASAKGQIPNT